MLTMRFDKSETDGSRGLNAIPGEDLDSVIKVSGDDVRESFMSSGYLEAKKAGMAVYISPLVTLAVIANAMVLYKW